MSNPMVLFAEDGYIPVRKMEHEELVRDSEKLRCIENLARNKNIPFYREMILSICGYVIQED